MIVEITFEEIYHIWAQKLWPNRLSTIEPNSAMKYLGDYDLGNMSFQPTFFACYLDNKIVGVNSGHLCIDNGYRSRGLYVDPLYRNQGLGTMLLLHAVELAIKHDADYIWSYPRFSSWQTYQKAGFILSSEWEDSEIGKNAYCIKSLVPTTFGSHPSNEIQVSATDSKTL